MPPKKYKNEAEKKSAEAERKRLQRQNITQEKKDAEALRKARKRALEKTGNSNSTPPRQKYSKYVFLNLNFFKLKIIFT